jgi:hypothetical protein
MVVFYSILGRSVFVLSSLLQATNSSSGHGTVFLVNFADRNYATSYLVAFLTERKGRLGHFSEISKLPYHYNLM